MPTKFNATPPLASSGTVADLDAAIRSLELSTNPSKNKRTVCGCDATRHPLLAAAPNCLNCGKIICTKEGLGPCLFCNQPLLSSADVQSMIRSLREERGREKMEVNNASNKRPEVSRPTKVSLSALRADPVSNSLSAAFKAEAEFSLLSAAEQHRNKLLSYQASSAQRTHIIDEAADFETPSAGQSMWASPQERALQLKRQQKLLREQEWDAKPEYEKRRAVVSIDLVGGKIVKTMGNIERPMSRDEDVPPQIPEQGPNIMSAGGSFSRNPLLGMLIRPTYSDDDGASKSKGKAKLATDDDPDRRQKTWRRVQDDFDDNEALILDGGLRGSAPEWTSQEGEQPYPCG